MPTEPDATATAADTVAGVLFAVLWMALIATLLTCGAGLILPKYAPTWESIAGGTMLLTGLRLWTLSPADSTTPTDGLH
jgi:hypothetical protein